MMLVETHRDPISDQVKVTLEELYKGFRDTWFEAKEYDTRYASKVLIM